MPSETHTSDLAIEGKLAEAIAPYDRAIAIFEELIAGGRSELARDLAGALVNKGNALVRQSVLAEAIATYDRAISMLEGLVDAGRTELANDLASVRMNKALARRSLSANGVGSPSGGAEALAHPAANPDLQPRHFRAALDRFVADPSFANADLFCLNARLDWASISLLGADRPEVKARLVERVSTFLERLNRGTALLQTLRFDADEERRKTEFLRICAKRKDWADLFLRTEDVDRVEDAMWDYFGERAELQAMDTEE